jgi:protein arginine N-methyltransferase 1
MRGNVYSVFDYGKMITDRVRTDAYMQALRQAIRPDSVVADIGAGTGILSLLACKFGARRVFAIEPDDVIEVARAIAAANGYADRITFIQDKSTHVTLPEKANVIVSDLHGILPWCQLSVASIADARKRLLVPGGTLIPQREIVWCALVEAPDLYRGYATPWQENVYGLDMMAGARVGTNDFRKGRARPDQLLTPPQSCAVLDYATIEDPNVHSEITWKMTRQGIAHGFCLWFDSTLAEGIGFSNAPSNPELIYGSAFFPLSVPTSLAVDDTVSITLQANVIDEEYLWRWNTRVFSPDQPGKARVDLKQSTFFGVPLSPARLRRQAADYIPRLKAEGQVDLAILALMNEDVPLSLEEIARRVSQKFPDRFASWQMALARVGELSQTYGSM